MPANTLIKPSTICALIACAALSAPTLQAGPFDKGRKNISIVVGSGSAFRGAYTVVGVGIDYLIADGLQLGVDAQGWFGDSPKIYKISPQLSYVFSRKSELKPYAGGFYRKTFIESLQDLESAGFRVGAYFNNGNGYQMGLGYVYETYLNCESAIYSDCTTSYPEVVMSISL